MNRFYLSLIFFGFLSVASTAQNVTLLKDINPGVNGSYVSGNKNVIEYKGNLYFTAQNVISGAELYKYDGQNVNLVKDINPGSSGSNCDNFYILNDKLIFSANNGTNGKEWWTSDGTEAGTSLLKDINPGLGDGVYVFNIQDIYYDGNQILYAGGVGDNIELYKTDGTSAGTVLLKNISPDNIFVTPSFPNSFVLFKSLIYFDTRAGLYKTDGTTAGTVLVKSSFDKFSELFNFNDQFILMMVSNDIWKSNGTKDGTVLLKSMGPVTLNWLGNRFAKVNNLVLFPGVETGAGEEIWQTDGTVAGTKMLVDLWPGNNGGGVQNQVVLNGKLYYKGAVPNSGAELISSDGTAAGTKLLKEFSPGSQGGFSLPTEIMTDGKSLFMNAGLPFNKQLWISDGTREGTKEIVLNSNEESYPINFNKFKNSLFLFAKSDANGYEPYLVEFDSSPVDADGDGFAANVDCNDNNAFIFPGASEVCDGKDNNCDGAFDEGLPIYTYYQDLDGDGFGTLSSPLATCYATAPTGYALIGSDCNDTNIAINPSAIEIANNGIDEDCNGADLISSVHDIYASRIKVYPNPASSSIFISNDNINFINAGLYTLTGLKIKDISIDSNTDVSELNAGIYLLQFKIKDLDIPIYKKLIIQN